MGVPGRQKIQTGHSQHSGTSRHMNVPREGREEPCALGAWEGHVAGTHVVDSPAPAFCPQIRDRASHSRSHMHTDTDK